MKKIKSKQKRIKRTKLIHMICILLPIMSTLIASTTVSAGTQDSNLVRNTIDGVYAVAPLSDRTHLYNLEIYKVNNRVSYCIEIGKSITSNIYNSTNNLTEQSSISNLTQNQLYYIKQIMYLGYAYPTHDDYKY